MPEQPLTGHYSTAVDVYSIGVMVMEMAGLTPPDTHSDRVALYTTRTDLANSIATGEVQCQQHESRLTSIPSFLFNLETLLSLVNTILVYTPACNHVSQPRMKHVWLTQP